MNGFNIGFIKLYRSFIDWEWYHNNNVKVLFIHILLSANYENKNWQGITINKGQFITSTNKLAQETNLSIQQVRTSLNKLKNSGEISIKSTNKFTIITVNNFVKFQNSDFNFSKHSNDIFVKSLDCSKQSINSDYSDNLDDSTNSDFFSNNQSTFDKHIIEHSDNLQLTSTKEVNNINNIKNVNNIYQYITDMYNQICTSFPRCNKLSNSRIKAIKSRLKIFSLDDFNLLFVKAQNSDYLKGANSYNWSANFDWLISDKNFAKVIDGNYDNNNKSFVDNNLSNNNSSTSSNVFMNIAREEGLF